MLKKTRTRQQIYSLVLKGPSALRFTRKYEKLEGEGDGEVEKMIAKRHARGDEHLDRSDPRVLV